jgi:hypothetical protein
MRMKRSWHAAETCSSSVELTRISVTARPRRWCRTSRILDVTRLAEAVAAREPSEHAFAAAYFDLARHDDVKAIVHLAFADDLFPGS